jgi:hypothetical protein
MKRLILPSTLLIFCFIHIPQAAALSLSFDLGNFMISNVTTTGVNLTADPLSAPVLPADSTFTLPADTVWSPPPNPSNTYLAQNEGKFVRFTFDLPAGYKNLAFSF